MCPKVVRISKFEQSFWHRKLGKRISKVIFAVASQGRFRERSIVWVVVWSVAPSGGEAAAGARSAAMAREPVRATAGDVRPPERSVYFSSAKATFRVPPPPRSAFGVVDKIEFRKSFSPAIPLRN